jgi:hypothetical protein
VFVADRYAGLAANGHIRVEIELQADSVCPVIWGVVFYVRMHAWKIDF